MTRALDKLVREARQDLGVREVNSVDWKTVDEALFRRIDLEDARERARFAPTGRGLAVAAALAVAAVAAVAIVADRGPPSASARLSALRDGDVAFRTVAVGAGGVVRVNGKPAAAGADIKAGDAVDVEGADATIEIRGQVTLQLESGSRVRVTRTGHAVVVSLEAGAIEASVVPTPSGEAFAVDVDHARLAAHGTHFRVARVARVDGGGERVVIDLNEGVVVVGLAPRVGPVLGAMMVSPAHGSFAADDPAGTLEITHDPAAVRAPLVLAQGTADPPAPAEPSRSVARPIDPQPARPMFAAPGGGGVRAEARSASDASAQLPSEPDATAAITDAVRACMATAEAPSADNVTVVVSTTLYLNVTDDGSVHSARFDPPVLPDVNACAAPAIYRAHFARGGAMSLPIGFTK